VTRSPDEQPTTDGSRVRAGKRGAAQRTQHVRSRTAADQSRRPVPPRRPQQRPHRRAVPPGAAAPLPTLRLVRSYDPVDDLETRLRRIYALLSVPSLDPPDHTSP
jgi:hypothetical protein